MNGNKKRIILIFLGMICLILITIKNRSISLHKIQGYLESGRWSNRNKLEFVQTRDFIRYNCNNMKRIGGQERFVKNAPDSLYRIDGAWNVCFDKGLAPVNGDCVVLSFGVNYDYSFDQEINEKYGCQVHSFDPVIEAPLFNNIRKAKSSMAFSPVLDVNEKWKFYKLGISTDKNTTKDASSLKVGAKLELKPILKLAGLEDRIIDIFKMDIEGEEKGVFDKLEMDYACKYIKQLMFETHKNFKFNDLVKLEECFFMFHRHTRFFVGDLYNQPTGLITEFQRKNYQLNLSMWHNEIEMAEYMFVNGEFYFVNENFFT